LPWPHLRFKCANAAAFRHTRDHGAVVAELSPTELAGCWTHTVDWARVAAAAVEVVHAGHDRPPQAVLERLGAPLNEHLFWLFAEPILLNGTELGNGQHRVCAMKAQGVPRVPVENPAYDPLDG
jgi:hypothetical protein